MSLRRRSTTARESVCTLHRTTVLSASDTWTNKDRDNVCLCCCGFAPCCLFVIASDVDVDVTVDVTVDEVGGFGGSHHSCSCHRCVTATLLPEVVAVPCTITLLQSRCTLPNGSTRFSKEARATFSSNRFNNMFRCVGYIFGEDKSSSCIHHHENSNTSTSKAV